MIDEKINLSELKNLRFEYIKNEYVVTLVDNLGFKILKGYGNSIVDAINDLHQNLI